MGTSSSGDTLLCVLSHTLALVIQRSTNKSTRLAVVFNKMTYSTWGPYTHFKQ